MFNVCVYVIIGNRLDPNHYISYLHFYMLLWRCFRNFPSPIHISNIFFKLLRKIPQEQKQPPEVFYKKGVLENFANFTGKNLFKPIFDKVAGLKTCEYIEKRLQYRSFPIKFWKFLRTSFLKNICERLLPTRWISIYYIN